MVRYPQIQVRLRTSNPVALVSAVRNEMRRAGLERTAIDEFSSEALGGDPNHIRRVCSTWVALPERPDRIATDD